MKDLIFSEAGPATRDDFERAIRRARALRSHFIRCQVLALMASIGASGRTRRVAACLGQQPLPAPR